MSEFQRYVTCRCQHCDKGIEFDASGFEKGETRDIECPHCHLETKIFVPQMTQAPGKSNLPLPRAEPIDVRAKIKRGVRPLRIKSLILGGIIVCCFLVFIALATRSIWSKSSSIRQDDIQITIGELYEGGFGPNYAGGVTSMSKALSDIDKLTCYLNISLEVSNLNSTKIVDFTTWRDDATLTDNYGNTYKRINFESEIYNAPDQGTIYPNHTFRDLIVFQLPVKDFQWLHLKLPAKNFGSSGAIRFEIPAKH